MKKPAMPPPEELDEDELDGAAGAFEAAAGVAAAMAVLLLPGIAGASA